MCGEHWERDEERDGYRGSSPHVRGAPCAEYGQLAIHGIIPACAGSTTRPSATTVPPRDHPRMCGEHPVQNSTALANGGSSPHVRGAQGWIRWLTRSPGIIPACAGSTHSTTSRPSGTWDHPRMCGEHFTLHPAGSNPQGSSPHVRGAPDLHPGDLVKSGIIPACAGSTMMYNTSSISLRDHPRMCGEHFQPWPNTTPYLGSSPHVRGAQKGRKKHMLGRGIIPACAGSTPNRSHPQV